MEIEYGLGEEVEEKTTYQFDKLSDGASVWVATHSERVTMMTAFARWKDRSGSNLSARSAAVSDKDPKGRGYRIWFKTNLMAMKPSVMARVLKLENMNEFARWRVNYSGIETADDMLAAIASTGTTPSTITEINEINVLIMKGMTPFQVGKMKELGRPLPGAFISEREHNKRLKEKDADWPADDGRDVSPVYESLSADQRKLLREAHIENADEYGKAMRRECMSQTDTAKAFSAVLGGYSDYSTWKLNRRIEAIARAAMQDGDA